MQNRAERKYKLERNMPPKPSKEPGVTERAYKKQLQEYNIKLGKAKQMHVMMQEQSGTGFNRPARPKWRKVTAILLPLFPFDIETYKPSEFEKNHRGKIMMIEKGSIIGVGRVDRLISTSAETFMLPTTRGVFRNQLYLH